jgi:hypothetical protein
MLRPVLRRLRLRATTADGRNEGEQGECQRMCPVLAHGVKINGVKINGVQINGAVMFGESAAINAG